MRFRQGVLSLCAALAAALPAPGAAAPPAGGPLGYAQGDWSGKADNGHEVYQVSVSLKESAGAFQASCKGRSASGDSFRAGFSAPSGAVPYEVTITYGLAKGGTFSFDVTAAARSGTELEISSAMGGGTLKFLNDFTKCELRFESLLTRVSATLYRNPKPPQAGKAGAAAGRKKGGKAADRKPLMPPMEIVGK